MAHPKDPRFDSADARALGMASTAEHLPIARTSPQPASDTAPQAAVDDTAPRQAAADTEPRQAAADTAPESLVETARGVAVPATARHLIVPSKSEAETQPTSPGRPGAKSDDMVLGQEALGSFRVGELVAGRFKVVRYVAKGGMGEVYEADDLDLKERVALKTIRPELAAKPEVMARFTREIQLARKVTHPNVSRVYDLFHHRKEILKGRTLEVLFLSMELLDGETLSERIAREGKLTPEVAFPIAEQIISGLQAAHGVGVIHRDLKTLNVILVSRRHAPGESREGPPPLRAVVTDFGLALEADESGDSSSNERLTAEPSMMGTPAYMAPEQIEGNPVTLRTDLYALGILLHELVSGRRPGDEAKNAALLLLERLKTEAPALSPGLDPRWERTIARCLRRDPAQRFASGAEVLESLRAPPPAAAPSRQLLALLLSALVIGAVSLAVGAWLLLRRVPDRPSPKRRPVVAVLRFDAQALPATERPLGSALAERVVLALEGPERLRILPADARALKWREAAGLPSPPGQLGARFVVQGTLDRRGLALQLLELDGKAQPRLVSKWQLPIVPTTPLLPQLRPTLTALRKQLDLAPLPEARWTWLQSRLPARGQAALLHAEGREQLQRGRALAALTAAQRALHDEPRSVALLSLQADAQAALGYAARARASAKLALDQAASWPERDRLGLAGRHAVLSRAFGPAVSAYQKRLDAEPDQIDFALDLAEAELAADQPKTAQGTLTRLRAVVGELPPDGLLCEARAALGLKDLDRAVALSNRAHAGALALGAFAVAGRARLYLGQAHAHAKLLPAEATAIREAATLFERAGLLSLQADAEMALGDAATRRAERMSAERHFEQALKHFRQLGNRASTGHALAALSRSLRRRAERTLADRRLAEALAEYREVENQEWMAQALRTLAGSAREMGRVQEAVAQFEEAAELSRRLGASENQLLALRPLFDILLHEADLRRLRVHLDSGRAICKQRGDAMCLAQLETRRVDVALELGDLTAARSAAEEGVAGTARTGSKGGRSWALIRRAMVHFHAGNLRAASTDLTEALKTAGGDKEQDLRRGRARLYLGAIQLAERHPAEAEKTFRLAITDYVRGNRADQALAQIALGQSLLAQRRASEVGALVVKASALIDQSKRKVSQLAATAALAALKYELRDLSGAEVLAQQVLARARPAGLTRIRLEAELTEARARRTLGQPDAAGRLQALRREAQSLGFLRVVAETAR